ncbi:MAG: c-type cytochrome [Proteobacteria bacterium]|nr:MAG: c-type cytochrome [Pseudomonadota bacterium]
MSSRCRELGLALAALTLTVACQRERREFDAPSPSAPSSGLAMTELQPGAPAPAPPEESPYAYNAYAISQGKRLFEWFNCSGCHAHGGGDIGPALMDDRWIYGSSPSNLFATIVEGRPNGMPAFRAKLNDTQVWQLVAYVQALTGELTRDAVPARDDHLFHKPGEQSLPEQPKRSSTQPPSATRSE